MNTPCDLCDGLGMRMLEQNGKRSATPCPCTITAKTDLTVRRAGIPRRYADATFQSFHCPRGGPVAAMYKMVRGYVQDFLPGQHNGGLLLTGTVGTGKTHLAVAALRELMMERGQTGAFADARDTLNRLRASFAPGASVPSAQVLDPLLGVDVLVIDELGAARQTDWTADVIEYLINGRYNAQRSTIITTNYPTAGPRPVPSPTDPASLYSSDKTMQFTRETLTDRIGARMYSRVMEMCRTIQVQGEDYRQRIAAARFAT